MALYSKIEASSRMNDMEHGVLEAPESYKQQTLLKKAFAGTTQLLLFTFAALSIIVILLRPSSQLVLQTGSSAAGFTFPQKYILPGASPSDPRYQIPTFFDNDERFQSLLYSHDKYWEDLAPQQGILDRVDGAGTAHSYGLSMFHQLHCLTQIRSTVQLLAFTIKNHTQQTELPKVEELVHTHVLHCLDYIRQAILCHADDNVENEKYNEHGLVVINGMEYRQCRDPQRLYDLVNNPQYNILASQQKA